MIPGFSQKVNDFCNWESPRMRLPVNKLETPSYKSETKVFSVCKGLGHIPFLKSYNGGIFDMFSKKEKGGRAPPFRPTALSPAPGVHLDASPVINRF